MFLGLLWCNNSFSITTYRHLHAKGYFKVEYNADFRQEIADKWPKSINDDEARKDWNWKPKYDLKLMTLVMLEKLEKKYNTTTLK